MILAERGDGDAGLTFSDWIQATRLAFHTESKSLALLVSWCSPKMPFLERLATETPPATRLFTMSAQGWNNSKEERVLKDRHDLFERTILPHLNSAYNLARWLTRNEHDAQDIVQDAFLRALRAFDTFVAGRDARAWILTIVRNCCRTWLKKNRSRGASVQLDDESDSLVSTWSTPEAELIKSANAQLIGNALEELPVEYREILILREYEELSYKEIAEIIEAPLGTVMSRLSRARRELYVRLSATTKETRL